VASIDEIGPLLPELARRAIRAFLTNLPAIEALHSDAPRAPVFVTLRNPDGSLRGCIGSVRAIERDVAAETARSAVLAASRDPRFDRVRLEELERLRIDVSVLMPEEPISGVSELDPSRYGVIVRDPSGRQGLLLPDVPGIDDASTQVHVAREKAGVPPGATVTVSRFEVRKFRLEETARARR
jgi:AmmeMemoRadiSam system protein A